MICPEFAIFCVELLDPVAPSAEVIGAETGEARP